MKLFRKIKSWFVILPMLWFMYVSVQLMMERSASLAAMEMANHLHQQDHHMQNQLSLDSMPKDPETIRQIRRIWEAMSDVTKQSLHDGSRKEKPQEEKKGEMVKDQHNAGPIQLVTVAANKPEDDKVTFPPYVEEWFENGPGEGGKPIVINQTLLSPEEKERYNKGWQHNSFNQYASDMMSVHRSLPDNRSPECKAQQYAENLPEVSVIIIFHNEAWSVLLRSVHSILNRTPKQLLRQVILVDDYSTMEHLKRPLEVYWRREPKVTIVHAPKRMGLTRARILGYNQATAPVLVFLDSHIECFPGWLEPMLARVNQNPNVTVFPSIETIQEETLAVQMNNNVDFHGIFRWKDLNFNWQPMPESQRKKRTSAFSPIRFVVTRAFCWLPPLLDRIVQDPRNVPYPNIEIIYDDTLHVTQTVPGSRAIFRLRDLTFQWEFIPDYEKKRRKSNADPIRSPTMPGGLFAIDRDFFTKLGAYDPELDYWGGENIELSFKAWMCHGAIELIPCSHIGHIFRRSNPIHWMSNVGPKNSVRVAEVWMDDYKNYFYEAINYKLGEYGDVTDRRKLREQLQCHDFAWYIENVFPNIKIPRNVIGAGEIRNEASPQCIDNMGGSGSPKLYPCHGLGTNQFWYFSKDGVIYSETSHICVNAGKILQMQGPCENNWKYREDKTIYHEATNKCMQASVTSNDITLEECNDSKWQKWNVQPRRTDLVFP
ncbi:hypothetical protein BaRGS_00022567 [Batillaria attramentaria]|uniref:Polypeptide N-acetylgalactosaminyltransferase n=1 Tax=Batillaria attramentaria TaxID=370345 RepID=A0ABD0KGF8_9CAEN